MCILSVTKQMMICSTCESMNFIPVLHKEQLRFEIKETWILAV